MFGRRSPESGTKKTRPEDAKLFSREDREAFDEIERLTPILLASLYENIQKGSIGGVIGIDGSGRIPALLLSRSIGKMHEKRGFPKPELHFLSGNISKDPDVRAYLPKAIAHMGMSRGHKVLVVDDTFNTGQAALPIIQTLKAQGYEVEFAVYNCLNVERMRTVSPRFHFATEQKVLKIFKRSDLTGVRKVLGGAIYAEVKRPTPEKVDAVRRVIADIADRAVTKYERTFGEKE